jgi:hypothetical protein
MAQWAAKDRKLQKARLRGRNGVYAMAMAPPNTSVKQHYRIGYISILILHIDKSLLQPLWSTPMHAQMLDFGDGGASK